LSWPDGDGDLDHQRAALLAVRSARLCRTRRLGPQCRTVHVRSRRSLRRLLATARVRDGRLHAARHTAAKDLPLLGVHERTIMSVPGWSTTVMASRDTHVITPIHSDLASRLDGLL
jgi:hypothetical protein